jgi:heme exporter protein B
MNHFWAFFQKDVLLELRNKYALLGIFIYVISSVFICYLSFGFITDEKVKVALFWLIILFAIINAVVKSFSSDLNQLKLYYHTLTNPVNILFAKILFNSLLALAIGLINLFAFYFLFENFQVQLSLFMATFFLGTIALSSAFTVVSSIASQATNGAALTAILGFPVIAPIIILIVQLSNESINMHSITDEWEMLCGLALMIVVTKALGYLLFPYLWRD